MPGQLKPYQMLRELHALQQMMYGDEGEQNPAALKRKFFMARTFGKVLKPLLKFKRFAGSDRSGQLLQVASQTMTADVLWAITPAMIYFKKYLESILAAAEKPDKPLVWLEWCITPEILHAFDAIPVIAEGLAFWPMMLGPDKNIPILQEAEQSGVPEEFCSMAKASLGAFLAEQLPAPDCIVTSSTPCDSMASSYQMLKQLTQAPTFQMDMPYWDNERAIDYYTSEYTRLVAFLEGHLGRRLDVDRLRELITNSNKTIEMLIEINDMYRATPCPGSTMTTLLVCVMKMIGLGTPELAETVQRLHKITKDNFKAGKGTIKKEKIRVIWFDVQIAFYPLVLRMEEELGAVVLTDILSFISTPFIDTSTRETMVRGLAESCMNYVMTRQVRGPVEFYLDDLARICEEYSGDCIIISGHVPCQHFWASSRIIKDYIRKNIGVPVLWLTSDYFDRRMAHENQLMEQIKEFFTVSGLV